MWVTSYIDKNTHFTANIHVPLVALPNVYLQLTMIDMSPASKKRLIKGSFVCLFLHIRNN